MTFRERCAIIYAEPLEGGGGTRRTLSFLSLLLAVIILFSLSGCGFFAFDSRSLMAPPAADADQQAITRLLWENSGDITLVYPKNGEHRSAILMEDFTGDGERDAIGFYIPERGGGGVEVQFLTKTGGEWVTASTFKNVASQVDRVSFCDLTGDSVPEVLVGWGNASGTTGRTAAMSAYIFSSGKVEEFSLGAYGAFTETDLDQDGVSEVFMVDMSLPVEGNFTNAEARVYVYDDGEMSERYVCPVDNSVSGYSSLIFGKLSKDLYGVLVDGTKPNGSTTTQVITLENGKLINRPENVNTDEYLNFNTRPTSSGLSPMDIDGDGIIDLPYVYTLPALQNTAAYDSTCFEVDWKPYFGEDEPWDYARTLVNVEENYFFSIPPTLEGKLTSENNTGSRMLTYRLVSEEKNELGEALFSPGEMLFSIRCFSSTEWEVTEWRGYEPILVSPDSDTVYAIHVYTSDPAMTFAAEQVKKEFHLFSDFESDQITAG